MTLDSSGSAEFERLDPVLDLERDPRKLSALVETVTGGGKGSEEDDLDMSRLGVEVALGGLFMT